MSELYELPEGWEWKKLEELTEVNLGKTPTRSKKEYFLGDSVWLSIRDLKGDYVSSSSEGLTNDAIKASNIKIVPKGTLLMSFKLTLGRTAFADCDLYTNEAIAALPIKDESKLDKYFLKYSIGVIDLEKEVDNAVKGKTLNKQKIKNLDIPLPPLQEQKRIVVKLDKLFEKIDKAIALHQKNMDEADVFMGSVLNEVFGELEERYHIDKIGNFSKVGTGVTPLKSRLDYYDNGKINWITSKATNNDYVVEAEQLVTQIAIDECRLKMNPVGTIIVALYGQGKTRGQVSELKIESATNQALATILVDDNKANNRYLKYFLNKSYIDLRKKASGGTQPNLNLTIVKNIELPLPPLNIQQKTVKYLDQISEKTEKLKSVQKEKMESLKALKASLLDRAFRGEL